MKIGKSNFNRNSMAKWALSSRCPRLPISCCSSSIRSFFHSNISLHDYDLLSDPVYVGFKHLQRCHMTGPS